MLSNKYLTSMFAIPGQHTKKREEEDIISFCCFLIGIRLGVNFTKILRAAFLHKSVKRNFSGLAVSVYIFWQKEISVTAARTMLVKMTILGGKGRRHQ